MKKILVIDDDPAVLEYLQIVMNEFNGISADFISNIDDAISKVESGEYGAILSDFYMKKGTVLPLYLINRSKHKLPFALLSGEFPDYIRGWFIDEHIPRAEVEEIRILGKPFDIDELGNWLNTVLGPTSY